MIKIDVISGFLGAGKTTLIKKLFENVFKNEKVVLIENEFGEIGIDGSFLKESGIKIKEINSGCICCSLVGDFSTSMKEVISTYNPERIIIEPSGVGKLSDIVKAIEGVDADLQLNILATVVDASKAKIYMKNFGEFFVNQVASANTIVVSKVDKVSEDKLIDVVNLIKDVNTHANIITTDIESFKDDDLLHLLEEKVSLKDKFIKEILKEEHDEECCCGHDHEHHHDDEECCCGHDHEHHQDDEECCCGHDHEHHHDDEECCCGHDHEHHHDDEECCCGHDHDHHHHHHHADEVFTSWGIETPKSISKNQLENFLEKLAFDNELGIIIRSKGILKASDNDMWYYFDFVAGDYEIRLGNPDYTGRLVVIGSKLNEKKIEELFNTRD